MVKVHTKYCMHGHTVIGIKGIPSLMASKNPIQESTVACILSKAVLKRSSVSGYLDVKLKGLYPVILS